MNNMFKCGEADSFEVKEKNRWIPPLSRAATTASDWLWVWENVTKVMLAGIRSWLKHLLFDQIGPIIVYLFPQNLYSSNNCSLCVGFQTLHYSPWWNSDPNSSLYSMFSVFKWFSLISIYSCHSVESIWQKRISKSTIPMSVCCQYMRKQWNSRYWGGQWVYLDCIWL